MNISHKYNLFMLCDFALSVVKAFDTKENLETIFLECIKGTSFSPWLIHVDKFKNPFYRNSY